MRTIRRYPNRKLYDLQESRYVNLDEVYQLVRAGEPVQVIDSAPSNVDITNVILLRALMEHGEKTGQILSTETLTAVIKSSDGTLKSFVEQSK